MPLPVSVTINAKYAPGFADEVHRGVMFVELDGGDLNQQRAATTALHRAR